MSAAYQRFLDFFELRGTERLDGLDASYFEPMTSDERERAYDLLWTKVERGGTEESVNGLFLANERRAVSEVTPLLEGGKLRPQAGIIAARNIYLVTKDVGMVAYFVKYMKDDNAEVRGNAAYYAPASASTQSLIVGLQGMVLTETERLPLIHAINKLLECHGVSEASVGKKVHDNLYRGLRADDTGAKNATFALLNKNFSVVFVDN